MQRPECTVPGRANGCKGGDSTSDVHGDAGGRIPAGPLSRQLWVDSSGAKSDDLYRSRSWVPEEKLPAPKGRTVQPGASSDSFLTVLQQTSKNGKHSLERRVYTAPDGSLGAPMVILIQDRFQGYTPNVQKQMNLTLQPNIKNSEWHPAKKSMEILESFEGVKRSFMIQALSSTELKGRFINYDGINPRGALRLTLDPKTESRPAIDVTSPDMLMDCASRDQMEGFLSDLETAEKELDDADSVLLWMISIQETGQPHPVLEGSTAQPTLNGKALPAGFMNK